MESRRVVSVYAGGIARCSECPRQLLWQYVSVVLSVLCSHVAGARLFRQPVDEVGRHNNIAAAGQQIGERS